MVGYNNLLATGQQPMATGSGCLRKLCGIAVAGEQRTGTGKCAGAHVGRVGSRCYGPGEAGARAG